MIYKRFADKKPVMLLDIQEQKIYAYPYSEFKSDLTKRSQVQLEEQYEKPFFQKESFTKEIIYLIYDEKGLNTKMVVLFVRDNEKRKRVSYSVE